MIRGTEVGKGQMRSPARQSNEGIGDGLQQAAPVALVTNSPPRTKAAMRKRFRREIAACRQRAEDAERGQQLATDQLVSRDLRVEELEKTLAETTEALTMSQDQLASRNLRVEELEKTLAETTEALTMSQALNNGLKRRVESLQNMDPYAWADEPDRGKEALGLFFPDGVAAEPLRVSGIKDRWLPGTLREVFLLKKEEEGVCACRRELAINGLKTPRQRFEDVTILGEGGFGVVRRGRCKKTKKYYAIKTTLPGNESTILVREMAAYAMLDPHKFIIGVDAISDVAGSEGIVMQLAICDLEQASLGTSETTFTLSQQIGFEADATEGLHFMHGAGMIHCDQKCQNVLICRSGGPTEFVGKVTDPGVWYGVGEMRIVGTGSLGWSPLENVDVEVEAAPDQDTFAVGVDLCSIVAHPDTKNEIRVINMWSHPLMMTADEKDHLQALRAEGSSLEQLRAEVTLRTMTDGSMSRIFLQPGNLNPTLPPDALLKTCDVLGQIVSSDPRDRPHMPVVTAFLRDLAARTAAREETLAGVPPGIEPPQDMALPVVPPVEAPHAEAEEDGVGAAVPLVEAIEAPLGSAPPVAAAGPVALPAVLPAVPPHAEGEEGGVGAAVPLGEAIEAPHGSALRDSAPPVAAAGPVALPAVLPVVPPHAEGEEDGVGAVMPLVEAIEAPHGSAPRGSVPPAAEAEHPSAAVPSQEETARGVPSMELGHLAPPPVVEPPAEGGHDIASADLPPAAMQVPADSGPPAAAPLAKVEASNADAVCLEEIQGRLNLLFRPFPRSPKEVLANHMADTLRTLGCPPPSASRTLAEQAYRGDVGGGSGSNGSVGVGIGGSGDVNGEGSSGSGSGSGSGNCDGGGGGGRETVGRASRGVLPDCSFLKRLW